MGIFISVPKTVECIALALFFSASLAFVGYKHAGILQECGYSTRKYFAWLKNKGNLAYARLALLGLLCLASSAVLGLCFSFAGEWSALISVAAYALFFIIYIAADNRSALRCPPKPTARFKRFYVVFCTLSAVVAYIFITLLNFAAEVWGNVLFSRLKYAPCSALIFLLPVILAAVNCFCALYEKPHNARFVKKAKAKLSASRVKVIAVTGSYGKTSVKHILAHILSRKFRVLSTPRSHNTPMGIALTVNGEDLDNYDYLILEMGARHVGDIAELCALFPPDYALITGICGQHLQTFGSLDKVVAAKGEIIPPTKNYVLCSRECYAYFSSDAKVKNCAGADDVVCSAEGVEFTFGGARIKSRLLGRHSAENIALAAELCVDLGMDAGEIAAAAAELDYIEHRLQLIKADGVNILDDGYNSNVMGARAALGVLNLFTGRRIVVTPGLVELGVTEDKENYSLGGLLAGVDRVILVGDTLIAPIKRGYLDNGGDAEKLSVCPTLFSAQEELRKELSEGDTVLFLNDLPDVY